MKKIFFAVLALAGLAACSTEDVVSRPEGAVIGFDNVFVENSTRANDLTAGKFDFGVYGSVINSQDQQGMIFTNQKINADGTYSPLQYWIAGATYNFVAFAPFTGAQWTYAPTVTTAAENGVLTFNNTGANQDLLFATATKTTAATLTASPGKVGFTFDHVLSRVRFTFTNGFTSGSNIKLLVTDVHITDAYKEGKMAVPAKTWTVVAGENNVNKTLNIDFDDVLKAEDSTETDARLAEGKTSSTKHFYLIPAEASYNVTFTVALYQAGVLVDTYDRTATLSYNMQPGYSYDIKANLNPKNTSDDGEIFPIEFQVTGVNDWANNGTWTDVNADGYAPVTPPTNN
ncbi:MAG: fimbrillin family protein [Alistipes sp.]|nr:fimbrillin family protein [Alistipes sp.]